MGFSDIRQNSFTPLSGMSETQGGRPSSGFARTAQVRLGRELQALYQSTVDEALPDRLKDLVQRIERERR